MVARLKESKVWSRWMWEKQTGWFFLGPKPGAATLSLKWDGFGVWV